MHLESPEYLDVPVFPLPNAVFFPGTALPLHIFEGRYRTMTANAIGGDRLIGVALLREGWQSDYFGKPPVCKTFGVGKVVDWDELADGRYNIVLEGTYRVRMVEEFPTEPYRTGRVKVLQDPPLDERRAVLQPLMKELQGLCSRAADLLPQLREAVAAAWAAHPHPMFVVNHLAASLVVDAYDRQSILEQDDPIRRVRLLLVQAAAIVAQLEGDRSHVEEMAEED